jgi:hypothetical protein
MAFTASTERGSVRRLPLRRAVCRHNVVTTVAFVAAVVAVAAPAAAAVLGPQPHTLGAGRVGVTSCGTLSSGVVTYVLTSRNVTGVVVSGLPASCDGGSLWVTLTVGTTAAAQAGPLPISGGTATATTLSANPAASTITDAYLAASG